MTAIRQLITKILPALQIGFTMIWLSNLATTDSYFSIYVLIAFFSFYFMIRRPERIPDPCGLHRQKLLCGILSVLFSLAVLLANYSVFTNLRDPERISRSTNLMLNAVNTLFCFVGGIVTAYPIIGYFLSRTPRSCPAKEASGLERYLPVLFFLSIVFVDLVHLFLVEYPGNVSEDPFAQIAEMVSGQYSNFNPFWHTILLQGALSAGYWLFGNANAAVAFFCVLQVLAVAFAFTYCLMTMYHYGVSRTFLFCAFLVYLIMPYHIALSITIWKDVLFSAGVLMTLCAFLRIVKGLNGEPRRDYLVLVLGSILMVLCRTFGWSVYLCFAVLAALCIRNRKKCIAMMGILAVVGWIVASPLLALLQIPGADSVEPVSIPIQQVSRVIAEGCEISDEDAELISQVVDLDKVPELYTNWLSDPMKMEIRGKNLEFFKENLSEFASLWIRLGRKYPVQYLKAWIDQTRGYWNGGYSYGMYSEFIMDNPYGVKKAPANPLIAMPFRLYFGLSRHLIFFEPFHSIGLHVWIAFLCCICNFVKKRKEWLLSVPLLILIVGLWFSTPVYCSFRYAYPLFVSFPLIVATTLYSGDRCPKA